MSIPKVAVRITVAGNENYLAATVLNHNFKPYQPLATKAGRHVVTVHAIFHLNLEGYTVGVSSFSNNVTENITGTQHFEPFLTRPFQQLQLLTNDFPGIIAVINRIPTLWEFVVIGNLIFERIGSPARLYIELQPLFDGGHLLRVAVMGKNAWGKNGVIRTGKEMIGKLAGFCRHAAHHGGGAKIVAGYHSLNLTHMAVLAGYATCGRGGCAIFTECLFQPKAVKEGDVMTGAAESRTRDRGKLFRFLMNFAPRFFGIGLNPVFMGIF